MNDETFIGICNDCGIEAELDIDTGLCACCVDAYIREQEKNENE